jgi:hypothetical protein
LTGFLVGEDCMAQPAISATYEVRFVSSWSALTHPVEFPGNAHFSGLIGATHNEDVTFWMPGESASDGIESMAETGRKEALTAEVEAAIADGTAEFVLSGGGINPSPGTQSLTFEISPEKPLVTLVSMVAPSPDWFVGTHGLNMVDGDAWRDTVTVTLDVYDAGTDSGTTYEAPNDDTDPAQPIAILNTGPFAESTVVGSYTFVRQAIVNTSEETPSDTWEIDGPYPNPSTGRFTIGFRGGSSDPIRLTVHDVTGRVVSEREVVAGGPAEHLAIDLSAYPSGLYVIRTTAGERAVTRRLVVVR